MEKGETLAPGPSSRFSRIQQALQSFSAEWHQKLCHSHCSHSVSGLKGQIGYRKPPSDPFKRKLYFFKSSKLPSLIPLFLRSSMKGRKGGRGERRKKRREGGRQRQREITVNSEITRVLSLYFSGLCTTHFLPKR